MSANKKWQGGCLVCNFVTTDRAELKAHNCTETMQDTWGKFQQELQNEYTDPALNCECGYQH